MRASILRTGYFVLPRGTMDVVGSDAGLVNAWLTGNLSFLANITACRSKDQQGDEQAHDGERGGNSAAIAVLTVDESGVEHIQRQRGRRLAGAATRQRQDGIEHLERSVDTEDEGREQN